MASVSPAPWSGGLRMVGGAEARRGLGRACLRGVDAHEAEKRFGAFDVGIAAEAANRIEPPGRKAVLDGRIADSSQANTNRRRDGLATDLVADVSDCRFDVLVHETEHSPDYLNWQGSDD